MKKILISILVLSAVSVSPAHAISAKYRAYLEKHHTTEQAEIHKADRLTPAPVSKRPTTALDYAASEAETVIGADIGNAADFLISKHWKANNGAWFKGGHELHLLVENGQVMNAQLVK